MSDGRIAMMAVSQRFTQRRRRISLPLLVLIILLHIAAIYGLARALVPDLTRSVERGVVSAFTVTITTPPEPPRPEMPDQEAEGASGDPGRNAVPDAVTAPTNRITLRQDVPKPETSSTGTAVQSGAAEAGDGTGAAGSGDGTGSGNQGSGRGSGFAATKPVHVSGTIDNARDYPVPEGGRQARRGTEVIVLVTVGTDGRARNCSIYRASPDPEADRLTCQLVEQRLGFRPATDSNGNPVAAPFYWRQRWF
jgi:periplasmic protein TonB